MAVLKPFRGVLYNHKRVPDLGTVITPPFDVISKEDQKAAYHRHPLNIIRLILNPATDGDSDQDAPHVRAANTYRTWLSEEILVKDAAPAYYITETRFPFEPDPLTRFGLISTVGLVPFEEGVVIPHEKTFSKVKEDRLRLMKASHANFSPIFSMYRDPENQILHQIQTAAGNDQPLFDFEDTLGYNHRLWRITDPDFHRFIQQSFQQKRIYIADGHHRYETCLNYRRWIHEATPGAPEDHPANYTLMYLSSMSDPGLVILPAHRLVKEIPQEQLTALMDTAKTYFEIRQFPYRVNGLQAVQAEFSAELKASALQNTIGIAIKDHPALYLLTLKPGVMKSKYNGKIPEVMQSMDVTVLTQLVFMDLLGFDNDRLDNESLIAYATREEDAIAAVMEKSCDAAFILNPTRIEQVKEIAENGLVMPRKATYFYPKVMVGLVLNHLLPE